MPKAARRIVFLLLVAALLALPGAVFAAGSRSPRSAQALQNGVLDLWSQLWSFFRKAGCVIDSGGLCLPLKDVSKAGCNIDPDGAKAGCTLDPGGAKAGCNVDPNGQCAPAPTPNPPGQLKIGCNIDPNGRCLP